MDQLREINYGSQFLKTNGVNAPFIWQNIGADADMLWDLGIRKVRIAYPWFDYSRLDSMKKLCTIFKNRGFYVVFGTVAGGSGATNSTRWNAFLSSQQSLVDWCALNNIDEYHHGNEEEDKCDNTTLTSSTIQNDERTSIANITNASNVVSGYSTSAIHIDEWISGGKGSIKHLTFNVYGSRSDFAKNINKIVSAFPNISKTYATQSAFPANGLFGIIYCDASTANRYVWNGTTYVSTTLDLSGVQIGEYSTIDGFSKSFKYNEYSAYLDLKYRMDLLKSKGLVGYIFTLRGGGMYDVNREEETETWSLIPHDSTPHDALAMLCNVPIWWK